MLFAPPDLPKFDFFTSVSEDVIRKVIIKSNTISCLLDPWSTILSKEYLDILLPSVIKFLNCFLSEVVVPTDLEKAIVSPLMKKVSLPPYKNAGLGFIS